MNYISNGQYTIEMTRDTVAINGKMLSKPGAGHCVRMQNDKIFINGFEYLPKEHRFKRTFAAAFLKDETALKSFRKSIQD